MPNLYPYTGNQTKKQPWKDWFHILRENITGDGATLAKGLVTVGNSVTLPFEPEMVILTSQTQNGVVAIKIGSSDTYSTIDNSLELAESAATSADDYTFDGGSLQATADAAGYNPNSTSINCSVREDGAVSISLTSTGFSVSAGNAQYNTHRYDYIALGSVSRSIPPCPLWQTEGYIFEWWLREVLTSLQDGFLSVDSILYTGNGTYPRNIPVPGRPHFLMIYEISGGDTGSEVMEFYNYLQDGSLNDAQTIPTYPGYTFSGSADTFTRAGTVPGTNRIGVGLTNVTLRSSSSIGSANNVSSNSYELLALRTIEGLDLQSLLSDLSSLDVIAPRLRSLNKAALTTGSYTGSGGTTSLAFTSTPKVIFFIDSTAAPVKFYIHSPNMGSKVFGLSQDTLILSYDSIEGADGSIYNTDKRYNATQHTCTVSGNSADVTGALDTSGHTFHYAALG